jgi:hypothetical protein
VCVPACVHALRCSTPQACLALAVATSRGTPLGLRRCVLGVFAVYHVVVAGMGVTTEQLDIGSPLLHFHVGYSLVRRRTCGGTAVQWGRCKCRWVHCC